MSTARDHALFRLDHTPLPHWPRPILRRHIAPPADPRDVALSENITTGVIKNHLHLLYLQEHYSGKLLRKIAPLVQKILSIALYQLRFLTRIPASAAVDEAVKQARRFGQSSAAVFVNAILRNATRQPDPPLPDSANPSAFAERVLSHPPELLEKLTALLGLEDALRFCEHNNAEPPLIIRLFPGVDVATLSHPPDVTITPHQQSGCFVVSPASQAPLAHWSQAGLAQVQDPTAALVVPQLDPHPGQFALDRCCGLGTKTLQLHALVGPTGQILATDPNQARCQTLLHLLEQRQIPNVRVRAVGMLDELPPDQVPPFDRILIDAPCSNSGVLARRPEARYRQTPQALASLAQLQDRILDDTAKHLKNGGLLVYSTCSIWPEENRQRVETFLARWPGYRLLHDQLTLPSFTPEPTSYRDGGYFALIARG